MNWSQRTDLSIALPIRSCPSTHSHPTARSPSRHLLACLLAFVYSPALSPAPGSSLVCALAIVHLSVGWYHPCLFIDLVLAFICSLSLVHPDPVWSSRSLLPAHPPGCSIAHLLSLACCRFSHQLVCPARLPALPRSPYVATPSYSNPPTLAKPIRPSNFRLPTLTLALACSHSAPSDPPSCMPLLTALLLAFLFLPTDSRPWSLTCSRPLLCHLILPFLHTLKPCSPPFPLTPAGSLAYSLLFSPLAHLVCRLLFACLHIHLAHLCRLFALVVYMCT